MKTANAGSVAEAIADLLREKCGPVETRFAQHGTTVQVSTGGCYGSSPDFETLSRISEILGTKRIDLSFSEYECGTDVTPMSDKTLDMTCFDVRLNIDDQAIAHGRSEGEVMKPPADYAPAPYPLPDGKGLGLLDRWTVPAYPWVVLQYRDWVPYRCAIERLPFEGECVVYDGEMLRVAGRKYTLPMFGRPETWLRLGEA
jgi:hypothetical protein